MFNPSESIIRDAELVRDGNAYGRHFDGSLYANHNWIEAAERLSEFVLMCRQTAKSFDDLQKAFEVPDEELVD